MFDDRRSKLVQGRGIRVAVLGFGAMGQLHARTLASPSLDQVFTVTGIYDPESPASVAEPLTRYGSEDAAIADADLVVVATPSVAHARTTMRALALGRDVFVEKPMALTFADASAMVEAGRVYRRQLFVGHSERFNPVIVALAASVTPAEIRRIDVRRLGSPRRARTHDNAALLNLGVHDLDLVTWLTRSTLELQTARGNDDTAVLTLETTSGCRARIAVARAARAAERSIVVETRDQVFRGDLLSGVLEVTSLATGGRHRLPVDGVEPLVAQARELADALRCLPSSSGSSPSRSIATGVDGARAVLAAEQATAILLSAAASANPAENLS